MTATYTFDVFSSLDGYGAAGGDWTGYWGKQGPELLDHSLALYEAAGFTGAQADRAMATVFTYVLGNALGPAAAASLRRRLGRDGGDAEERLRDHMARARKIATQFPQLRARLDTAAADYAAAPEHSFEFGLQAILDGLEAQLTGPRPAEAAGYPWHG